MKHFIQFAPLPMERVWGGRELASLFGKKLPDGVPVGESWEIVDRPEAQSVACCGEWGGKSLNDLWKNHRQEVFGTAYANHPSERFPVLVKLLDARETLSVQVHPPAHRAEALRGEPKTEMWYFLRADEGACIYAGVQNGVDRAEFERLLEKGGVEDALIRLPVKQGESIFIPSGRLHAIGAGTVIAEIQQNSDTTYRVFDWNRLGLDGKPRDLHVKESLESIDFEDHAPSLQPAEQPLLADCPYFRVEKKTLSGKSSLSLGEKFLLWCVASGKLAIGEKEIPPGHFLLLPAGNSFAIDCADCEILEITLPTQG